MSAIELKLPQKLAWVFAKDSRYKGAYGGRGSGKSFSFALMCAVLGVRKKIRVLCAREFQNSIKDSVLQEVSSAIESHEVLRDYYDVGVNYIKGKNGTEFLFKGLRHNYREIKSTSQVDICWVEEAETVSEKSWAVLIPTIRAKGSEIWLTWNPESKDSSTHKRFILNPPENSRIVKLNYKDNPWFPEELEDERKRDLELNPDTYSHIWEGECLEVTEAQIFKDKWIVEDFEEHELGGKHLSEGVYYGTDFGFSNDPTAFVRCYIYDSCLYITHEAGGKKIDLDDLVERVYSKIRDFNKFVIRGDASRPETISYLKKNGLRIIPAKKWSGSVEDGIAHIRGYKKVIIHPRCTETIKEFRTYSYKVDRLSGDVLRTIVDANNHYIDSIRYALDPMIKSKITIAQAIKMSKGK